jgi:hypothetical protein
MSAYERCQGEERAIACNRRVDEAALAVLTAAIHAVRRSIALYPGMLLNGGFTDDRGASPEAFAAFLLNDDVDVPATFIEALLNRYAAGDGVVIDEFKPRVSGVPCTVREHARLHSKMASAHLRSPLKALACLVSDKQLCAWLT